MGFTVCAEKKGNQNVICLDFSAYLLPRLFVMPTEKQRPHAHSVSNTTIHFSHGQAGLYGQGH